MSFSLVLPKKLTRQEFKSRITGKCEKFFTLKSDGSVDEDTSDLIRLNPEHVLSLIGFELKKPGDPKPETSDTGTKQARIWEQVSDYVKSAVWIREAEKMPIVASELMFTGVMLLPFQYHPKFYAWKEDGVIYMTRNKKKKKHVSQRSQLMAKLRESAGVEKSADKSYKISKLVVGHHTLVCFSGLKILDEDEKEVKIAVLRNYFREESDRRYQFIHKLSRQVCKSILRQAEDMIVVAVDPKQRIATTRWKSTEQMVEQEKGKLKHSPFWSVVKSSAFFRRFCDFLVELMNEEEDGTVVSFSMDMHTREIAPKVEQEMEGSIATMGAF